MNMEHWWNDTDMGKTKVLIEKPVEVPLCPSPMPINWLGVKLGASAMTGLQLTT
jgi:hypothetical protein